MNLTDSQKHYIRSSFASMQDKNDFLALLNKAKLYLFGESKERKIREFSLYSLNYYSNTTLNIKRYKTFKVRKKNGKDRIISSPVRGLKLILRCLNLVLQCVFEKELFQNEKNANAYVMGFLPNRGIKENAQVHVNKNYVYNLDLQDFFHQIELHRIKACLKLPPFKLDKTREPLAFLIANLCCEKIKKEIRNEKGEKISIENAVLPQGAPTSPILSNIVCQKLDRRLNGLAKRFNASYTRYADDITFSSNYNIYQEDSEFIKELYKIIKEQNFTINTEKTRLQKSGYKQEVTGLIVNEKVNVNQHYIKNLRTIIHNWEKMGKEDAEQIFRQNYKNDKGHIQKGTPSMQQVVEGKLNFLKMVRGGDDATYKKLWERFSKLKEKEKTNNPFKYYTPKLPHNPLATTQFLRYFKYNNEFGLKELVHLPLNEESFDLITILEKANNFEFKETINVKVYAKFKNLLSEIEKTGIPFFKKERKHPLENSILKKTIQSFKQEYRFGTSKNEATDFKEIFDKTFDNLALNYSFRLHSNEVIYRPDEKKFKLRANFFTFVPSVQVILKFIIEGIMQHENYEGRNINSDANIFVSCSRERIENMTTIKIKIEHQNSYCLISKEELYRDIRNRQELIDFSWSICDWEIQAYFQDEEKGYSILIIPNSSDNAFNVLEEIPLGFTHILTFYDI